MRDDGNYAQDIAKGLAIQHHNLLVKKTDEKVIGLNDVYVVEFVDVLDNWRCSIDVHVPGGRHYEVTHSESSGKTYLDTYEEVSTTVFNDVTWKRFLSGLPSNGEGSG